MALLIFAAIAFQFPRAGKVIATVYTLTKERAFQFPRAGKVIGKPIVARSATVSFNSLERVR